MDVLNTFRLKQQEWILTILPQRSDFYNPSLSTSGSSAWSGFPFSSSQASVPSSPPIFVIPHIFQDTAWMFLLWENLEVTQSGYSVLPAPIPACVSFSTTVSKFCLHLIEGSKGRTFLLVLFLSPATWQYAAHSRLSVDAYSKHRSQKKWTRSILHAVAVKKASKQNFSKKYFFSLTKY